MRIPAEYLIIKFKLEIIISRRRSGGRTIRIFSFYSLNTSAAIYVFNVSSFGEKIPASISKNILKNLRRNPYKCTYI